MLGFAGQDRDDHGKESSDQGANPGKPFILGCEHGPRADGDNRSVLATARAGPGETGAGLHQALTRSRIPHLVLARDGTIQIVLPECAVVPGLATGLPAIGASGRIGSAGRLPEAAQEARWALGAAAQLLARS